MESIRCKGTECVILQLLSTFRARMPTSASRYLIQGCGGMAALTGAFNLATKTAKLCRLGQENITTQQLDSLTVMRQRRYQFWRFWKAVLKLRGVDMVQNSR